MFIVRDARMRVAIASAAYLCRLYRDIIVLLSLKFPRGMKHERRLLFEGKPGYRENAGGQEYCCVRYREGQTRPE